MICPSCKAELIWNNDYSFEEVGREGDGVCGCYTCPECGVEVEIFTKC